MTATFLSFEGRSQLAETLAQNLAAELKKCLTEKGKACLALSGGTTPVLFFEHLAQQDLNWAKVTITLVDERQVPETSPRSNAALVRKYLLQAKAKEAEFIPLYENLAVAETLNPDMVVLGMGEDGHTASFFPQGSTLDEALSPETAVKIIHIEAPAAGEPRLTFTAQTLRQAKVIYLHIEGVKKQEVLAKAQSPGPVEEMPIRAFLQNQLPLTIYWCP